MNAPQYAAHRWRRAAVDAVGVLPGLVAGLFSGHITGAIALGEGVHDEIEQATGRAAQRNWNERYQDAVAGLS